MLIPADLRTDLQAFHDRMARQYVTKSYDDMVALANARFAPEFVHRRQGRPPMDLLSISNMRDDELKNLKAGRSDGPVRWQTRLDGWSLQGDTLRLTAHHNVDGEWLIGNVRHKVHFNSVVAETWVRRNNEWKALRWDERKVLGTFDGKPFTPPKG